MRPNLGVKAETQRHSRREEQMIDGGGTQERKGGKEREKEKVAYQEAFRSSTQGWTIVSKTTLSLILVRFECPKDSGRKREKKKDQRSKKKQRQRNQESRKDFCRSKQLTHTHTLSFFFSKRVGFGGPVAPLR